MKKQKIKQKTTDTGMLTHAVKPTNQPNKQVNKHS